VIDTPGLRALRPDLDEATLASTFDDIGTLAARCRFRDCRHAGEPGCAVRERVPAIASTLSQDAARCAARHDDRAGTQRNRCRNGSARGKAARAWMKQKRGDG